MSARASAPAGAKSMEQKMIDSLMKRKRAYESYFKSSTEIDNSAQTAYTNIVKTIFLLAEKLGAEGQGDARDRVVEALRDEYGIERGAR